MSVRLQFGRNGKIRKHWYGDYYSKDGKREYPNLGVKVAGTPPESLRASDKGDELFEHSKITAEAVMKRLQEEENQGRIDKKTALLIYRKTTGVTLRETLITDLPDMVLRKAHHAKSTKFLKWKHKVVGNFVSWASGKKIKTVLDVSKEDVGEYIEELCAPNDSGNVRTAKTVRSIKTALGTVFERALPEGAPNPFRAKDLTIQRRRGECEYHREPLTGFEVKKLLDAAQSDEMMHDLFATALCSGVRRGDACRLRWDEVDFRNNTLRLTAHKTDTDLYLPILPLLRSVLEKRLAKKEDNAIYVFPEAEKMLRENPSGITYRAKKIFVMAFSDIPEAETTSFDHENLNDALPKVLKAINTGAMKNSKREAMIDFVERCAKGQSYRQIEKEVKNHAPPFQIY